MKDRLIKREDGSVAVYAIATVLCFVFLLGGIFYSSSAIRKNQLKTALKLKQIYAQEIVVEQKEPTQKEYAFSYTGSEQTFTAPANGNYQLQVWGAQGGSYDTTYAQGGAGGYSKGTIKLKKGDTLYVYVGQAGDFSTTTTYTAQSGGGYNGGGAAGYRGGTGGGATDIRLTSGTWNNSDSLLSRIIVAGGGGGAYSYSSTYKAAGGYAGGTTGGKGSYYSSSYSAFVGSGATQTGGGSAGTGSSTNYNGKAGSFGQGGATGYKYNSTSYYSNGAGGGGWYGGGAAGNYSSSSRTRAAAGGGGSGFVWTSATSANVPSGYSVPTSYYLTDAETIAGNSSMPTQDGTTTMTGNTGNGYAKITWISF